MSNSGKFLSIVVVVLLAMGAVAKAERLNLSHPHYPLIESDFIDVTYDPTGGGGGGGLLTAIGYTAELDRAPGIVETLYGDFTLLVDINPQTGAATGGSLELTADYMTGERLFYSQAITAFGFGTVADDDILEFLFSQEGNMLAPDGEPVGVILTVVGASAPWDWSNPFDNLTNGQPYTGDGVATTFYMPEPSVAALLGLGAMALGARRRS